MINRYVFKKKINQCAATLLDILGYFLFRFFSAKINPIPGGPKNILVVRLDHLGDALLASAVPEILKKRYPDATVTFLTSSLGAEVLRHNPFVDGLLIYDAPWFLRKKDASGSRTSFGDIIREVRKKKFDLALSLRGDLRENYLLWRAGIAHRVGYGITGGGFFLNHECEYRLGVHESEHALDILRSLGIETDSLKPCVYFSPDEEKLLIEKMRLWGLSDREAWVGLQAESGALSKDWPEENVSEFLTIFFNEFSDKKMVLVGSDVSKSRRLEAVAASEGAGGRFLNLAGKTTLRELFFLFKYLKAFIGPDSGPAHGAAIAGVPTLFLYSGTNVYDQWKSLSRTASALREDVPCSPCHLKTCPIKGHPCMARIRPEKVVGWLRQLQWSTK